jgi:hypothetical protein
VYDNAERGGVIRRRVGLEGGQQFAFQHVGDAPGFRLDGNSDIGDLRHVLLRPVCI